MEIQQPLYVDLKKKMESWCAFQERSHHECRLKLKGLGASAIEIESVISELISANFLNEERFAIAFARGKFKIKHWGRYKILKGLKNHRVSDYCIKKAIKEIDPEEYLFVLQRLIEQKNGLIKEQNLFKKKVKLQNYALSKGFEQDLIADLLKNIVN